MYRRGIGEKMEEDFLLFLTKKKEYPSKESELGVLFISSFFRYQVGRMEWVHGKLTLS